MVEAQPPAEAAPRFDPETLTLTPDGLIPAIAQQHDTGEVLMLAWMTPATIAETLRGGRVVYWSRSRQAFWRKGDTSGHVQRLIDMRVDCDRDCLLLLVDQTGPACHTLRRSCFYTALRPENAGEEHVREGNEAETTAARSRENRLGEDLRRAEGPWREIVLTSPMGEG